MAGHVSTGFKHLPPSNNRRHPEVLAVLHGEPRRMGHKRLRRSFETPRKRAAPQDDGGVCGSETCPAMRAEVCWSTARSFCGTDLDIAGACPAVARGIVH